MQKSYYRNWLHAIVGKKTNPSNKESNWRRHFSRSCVAMSFFLGVEAFLASNEILNESVAITTAIFLSIAALCFFYWVVILPPFVHGSGVDPARLLLDTVVSTIFMICVFALWYRIYGIKPEFNALDALYFSTVTFSTLGFGDFGPKPNAQAFAGIQAILGNLHLGLIVGSTFAATQRNSG